MSRPQPEQPSFIERLQDRWETDPSFRTTWSLVGGAVALVVLITCVGLAVTTSGSIVRAIVGNPTATLPPDSGQRTDVGVATFVVSTSTPLAASPDNRQPIAVATSTTPVPSPTASPTPLSLTPTASGTPGNTTPTPGGTITPTVQANYQAPQQKNFPPPWTYGNVNGNGNTYTLDFRSDSSQAGKQLTWLIDFTNGCRTGQMTINLDNNGSATLSFTVPKCLKGMNSFINATGSFTIQGQSTVTGNYIASGN